MILKNYFLAFVPIFVAVDALGMLPVFISLTHGMKKGERNALVRYSALVALFVALAFVFVGKLVFHWLGITIDDFLVAGGTILFILSIRDLLSFEVKSKLPPHSMHVVPLAVPLMVGPAVLTTSLILVDSFGFFPTVVSICLNLLLCVGVLYTADILSKVLGETGSRTLSKIFNLLLAAIGIMLVRRGLSEIFLSFFAR